MNIAQNLHFFPIFSLLGGMIFMAVVKGARGIEMVKQKTTFKIFPPIFKAWFLKSFFFFVL
jgi:hypothetical protein